MKSLLYPQIVSLLTVTVVDTSRAQVIQVVSPADYVAPINYVVPTAVYAAPTTAYYGGATYSYTTRPYVTNYGYVPQTTVAPSYNYPTWAAPRSYYYGAMRPVAPARVYAW